MISLSLIDVGGQSWMLLSPSRPSGFGALSSKRPLMASYLKVSGVVRSFLWGRGRAAWGVITHAFERKKKSLLWVTRLGRCFHLRGWSLPPPWHWSPSLSVCGCSRESPQCPISSSPNAWTIGWASMKDWKWRPPQSLQPNRLPELLPAISSHYIRSKAIS